MARNPTRRSKLGLDEEETANDIRSRFASFVLTRGKMGAIQKKMAKRRAALPGAAGRIAINA
jgi:hypothetical protein